MQYEIDDIYAGQEVTETVVQDKEGAGFFDYLLGAYIIAMLATNYSPYNDALSTTGMLIPCFFLFTLPFGRYHFQREFFMLILLFAWMAIGAFASAHQLLSLLSIFYFFKVQFVMVVVALRCNSFRRLTFYLMLLAIGAGYLVISSLFTSAYISYDERLGGTVGEANAMGQITASVFVASVCLWFAAKSKWRLVAVPLMLMSCVRVLILSASRGSAVTVVIFVLVWSWYIWRRAGRIMKMVLPLAYIVAGVMVLYYTRGSILVQRLMALPLALGFDVPIAATGAAAEPARALIIKRAIEVFYQYPILGAGYGTFRAYSQWVYTHSSYFEFLFATGAVGTFLYHAVIVSGWLTLSKAKRLFKADMQIVRRIEICQTLIVAQLAAGLSLPCQDSKFQAILTGAWLGIVWYVRAKSRQYVANQTGDLESTAEAEVYDAASA